MRIVQPQQFNSTENPWQFVCVSIYSEIILDVIKSRSVFWKKQENVFFREKQ